MSAAIISEETLGYIADAIREKTNTSFKYTPKQMAATFNSLDNIDLAAIINGAFTAKQHIIVPGIEHL